MTNNKNSILLASILLVVGLGLVGFVLFDFISEKPPIKTVSLPERNDSVPQIPIMSDFGTKVVYTTDTTVDKNQYIDDCSTRGGVFDSCGSICDPSAKACSDQCALTCTVQ